MQSSVHRETNFIFSGKKKSPCYKDTKFLTTGNEPYPSLLVTLGQVLLYLFTFLLNELETEGWEWERNGFYSTIRFSWPIAQQVRVGLFSQLSSDGSFLRYTNRGQKTPSCLISHQDRRISHKLGKTAVVPHFSAMAGYPCVFIILVSPLWNFFMCCWVREECD